MQRNFDAHVRREATINGLTNGLFNGGIAWWLLRDRGDIPLWGSAGMAMDLAATAFILVVIVSIIVIPLQRRRAVRGTLPAAIWPEGSWRPRVLGAMPASLGLNALMLGLAATVIFVPAALMLAGLFGIAELSSGHYALFKGIWAALLAGVMVVPMVWIAARPAPR